MDKEQIKQDAEHVDSQMEGAAKAFGTPKWVLYIVGVLAVVGLIVVVSKVL